MPGDEDTLQYGKQTSTIYPISFLIRKLLAASSIIAFPKFAGTEAVEKAKSYINKPQIIDEGMGKLRMALPEYTDIDLCNIHVDIDGKNEEDLDAVKLSYLKNGCLDGFKRDEKIVPAINEYVNKYSYIGAISIMVRGGFINLLQAFLSANHPIKNFYDELLDDIGDIGNDQALKMVRDFIPA